MIDKVAFALMPPYMEILKVVSTHKDTPAAHSPKFLSARSNGSPAILSIHDQKAKGPASRSDARLMQRSDQTDAWSSCVTRFGKKSPDPT